MYKPYLLPDLTPLAEAKPRTFTPDLDGLVQFCGSKPADAAYSWLGHCLFEQFGEACGLGFGSHAYNAITSIFFTKYDDYELGIALPKPNTFGAALSRALSLREGAGT